MTHCEASEPSSSALAFFQERERLLQCRLIPALQLLQEAQRSPQLLPGLLWQGFTRRKDAAVHECLARLGLDKPTTWLEGAYRALVSGALARSQAGAL